MGGCAYIAADGFDAMTTQDEKRTDRRLEDTNGNDHSAIKMAANRANPFSLFCSSSY